jgi:hypothetical protein
VNPIKHPSNNFTFGPPDGMENCQPLSVTRVDYDGVLASQSYWRPEAAELAAIAAGKPIILTVYGRGHPPLWIGVEA